jgi:hypothetical protein
MRTMGMLTRVIYILLDSPPDRIIYFLRAVKA